MGDDTVSSARWAGGWRMIARAALCLLAGTAAAQDVAYFAAPSQPLAVFDAPGGALLGELAPGRQPLEATGVDGDWARIGFGEGDGWVELSALTPVTPPTLEGVAAPAGLLCVGTEPFWSLRLGAEAVEFAEPGGEGMRFALMNAAPAAGMASFPALLPLYAEGGSGMAILRPLTCHDGMSDRTHAWTVDLVLQGEGGLDLRTGCCRLPAGQ